MSTFELFAFAIAVPGIIIGIKEFWDWISKPDAAPTAPTEFSPIPLQQDRVLITFDRALVEKPGTFEHALWGYLRRFPKSYYAFEAANPYGLLRATQFSETIALIFLPYAVIILLFGFYAVANPSPNSPYGPYLVTLMGLVGAAASFVFYRRHRNARQIAEDYVRFFKEHGLFLSAEFTQLRSKYDAGTLQNLPAPSPPPT